MRKLLLVILFFFLSYVSYAQISAICATPGADGAQSLTTSANTFFPSKAGAISVARGATSIELDRVPEPFKVGSSTFSFGTTQITKGNLLLIIQMQGADINSSNSNLYGSGTAGNNGSGYSGNLIAGQYEYIVALNDVTTSGGILKFKGSGVNGGLIHDYENSNANNTRGQRSFQVVRLTQFSNLTMTNNIKTIPWNGRAGGLIAIDVAGTLDMNGKTIDASLTGFRGGYLYPRGITNEQETSYVTTNSSRASTKGEGIAGTPRFMWDGYNEVDNSANWRGYPNGDYGKGAPGNAGGGGNVHNAGGGGGGNGSAGGAGGYGWNSGSGDHTLAGGRPGSALPTQFNRLFLGGGGGSGDANNATNGVKGGVGGGIVIITANKIVGTGLILANGGRGEAGGLGSAADGAGGGGAGGSIFINVSQSSPQANLTIFAQGGNGGNSFTNTAHGPGGGGGGGVIYYHVPNATIQVNAASGVNGKTDNGFGINHGATSGAGTGIIKMFNPSELPPELQGISSNCLPQFHVEKSRVNPTIPIPAGSTTLYTIKVTNSGGGAEGVRIHDYLPEGFNFISANITYSTEPTTSISLTNLGSSNKPEFGPFNIPANSSATVQLLVSINSSVPAGTYHNPAYISYLDPQRNVSDPNRRITPAEFPLPNGNTTYQAENGVPGDKVLGSNYDLNLPYEDVIVVKPQLVVSKTVDQECVTTTGNTYSIIVKNEGTIALPITITDIMPEGLEVLAITAAAWDISLEGRTYTFKLKNNLAAAQSTDPILIKVRPLSNATQSNWSNTATEASGASATSILYANPTKATAKASLSSACNDGTFFMEGNQPSIGFGEWTILENPGKVVIVNPRQYNTAITGVEFNQSITARWTIKNGSCISYADVKLTNNSKLATAVLQTENNVSGTVCKGSPLPALQVVLTGTAPWSITYLDHTGFEITVNNITASPYMIPNPKLGIYQIKTVRDASGCFGAATGSVIYMESPATVGGNLSAPQEICAGETPSSLQLTGFVGHVVFWESSVDQLNWTRLNASENMSIFQPEALLETTYFRATVQSGSCPSAFSSVVKIEVNQAPTVADAGLNQINYHSAEFTLHANKPIVGIGKWSKISGDAIIENPNDPSSKVTISPNSSAILQWSISNGNCAISEDQVKIEYIKSSLITLNKTVSKTEIFAGDSLNYTISYINSGPSNAGDVRLLDQVTAHLKDVKWTATASGTSTVEVTSGVGNHISIGANLKSGEENKIVLNISAKTESSLAPMSISNQAYLESDDPTVISSPSNIVHTEVLNQSALSILKTAPLKVNAGEEITYNLIIKNEGPSDAKDVIITDTILNVISDLRVTRDTLGNQIQIDSLVIWDTNKLYAVIKNLPAGLGNKVGLTIKGIVSPNFSGDILNQAFAHVRDLDNPPVPSNKVKTEVVKKADIRIIKSGPATAIAGNQISYTINVSNVGPSDAENVHIQDILPQSIKEAKWTVERNYSIPSNSSGEGNVDIFENIPVGKSLKIIISGKINSNFSEKTIENTATATVSSDTEDPTPATSTVVTEVKRFADLKIVKSGPAHASAGKSIQYKLEVTNLGPSDANNLKIQDIIDEHIIGDVNWSFNNEGGASSERDSHLENEVKLLANIPALTGKITIDISGIVLPDTKDETVFTNIASVITKDADIEDDNQDNNNSKIVTQIDNDPIVKVSKSGPSTVDIGGKIVYEILVQNGGLGNIVDAEVIDHVPNDVEVSAWSVEVNGSAQATVLGGNSNIVETIVDIPVGDENYIKIKIEGTVKYTTKNSIINTVTVTAGNYKESSVITSVNHSTDLAILKSGPSQIFAGELIHYTLAIYNHGPLNVQNLRIKDEIPNELIDVNWEVRTAGSQGYSIDENETGSGNELSILANLEAGPNNVIIIDIYGKVPSSLSTPFELKNKAILDLSNTGILDYNLSNNSSEVSTQVLSSAHLTVNKTGPSQEIAGHEINYNLFIRNTGPSDALALKFTDAVDENLVNVFWEATASGTASIVGPEQGTSRLVEINGAIPNGIDNYIHVKISGTILPSFEGQIKNQAFVQNANDAKVPSQEIVTDVSRKPQITINKVGPTDQRIGDIVKYKLTVNNTGYSDARNLIISDSISDKLSSVSWKITPFGEAKIINESQGVGHKIWAEVDLPAGEEHRIEIEIEGEIKEDASGYILNQAVAKAAEAGIDDVYSAEVKTFIHNPKISLIKTGVISADQNKITYTFDVINTGNVHLNNIIINDTKINAIVLPKSNLFPGERMSTQATYIISQEEKDSGQVDNTALVTGTPNLGNDVNGISGTTLEKEDVTIIPVPANPSLLVTKKITSQWPYHTVNDLITYEILVKNTGNVTLHDIEVLDSNALFLNNDALIPLLRPNEEKIIIAEHAVTQDDLDRGKVLNQALVTGQDPKGNPIVPVPSDDPKTAIPNDPTITELQQLPSLAIYKKVISTGPYSQIGDSIRYELEVINTGNVTLYQIHLLDDNGFFPNQDAFIESLAPLASHQVQVIHELTQADITAGFVANQAIAQAEDPKGNPIVPVPSDDPSTPIANDSTITPVQQLPSLAFYKKVISAGPYSQIGDSIRYELEVINTGNVAIHQIELRDDNGFFPNQDAFIGSLAPLASHRVQVIHELTQADLTAGFVANQALATGEDPKGNPIVPVPSDDPSTPIANDSTITPVQMLPELSIIKTAQLVSTYQSAGTSIAFEIVVTNSGNVDLRDVEVIDNNADQVEVGLIPMLKIGEIRRFTVYHTITQQDIINKYISNLATASGKDPLNNLVTAESKSGNPVQVGDPSDPNCAACTIVPLKWKDIQALDDLSSRVNTANGSTTSSVLDNDTLEGEIVSLSDIILSPGTAPIQGIMMNPNGTVTIAAGTSAGVYKYPYTICERLNPNNCSSAILTITVVAPQLEISKKANLSVIESAAEEIIYTITVKNTGDAEFFDLVISDKMFPNFIQKIDTLEVNQTKEYTLAYSVTQADIESGRLINTAEVTAKSIDGTSLSLRDSVILPVLNNTHIAVSKIADKTEIKESNERITYQIEVQNLGNKILYDIQISDPLTGLLEQLDQLVPGQKVILETSYIVKIADFDQDIIHNTVFVKSKDNNGQLIEAEAKCDVKIVPMPFEVPNIFTPNGDGFNDTFEIKGLERFQRVSLTIFNRWGNEVYSNHTYDNTWTGNNLNEGTYYYIIKTYNQGQQQTIKGWVMIKRK